MEAARQCSQEHLVLTWSMLHDIFRNSFFIIVFNYIQLF